MFREEMSVIKIAKNSTGQTLSSPNEQLLNISEVRSLATAKDHQILLGIFRIPNEKPAWGKTYVQNAQIPYSLLDKQVYLQGGNLTLLTN